jgi:uncharacterized membrane protein
MVMRGGPMSRSRLLDRVNGRRVRDAIEKAERRTSGEIRVSVARFFWGNVYKAATRAFERLGMNRTRDRNGVLLFVVPARRRFVVLGDSGIHSKVGPEFWKVVTRQMSERFRAADFTGGLVQAIETIGEQLSLHFPYDATTDANELPDDVDFGR